MEFRYSPPVYSRGTGVTVEYVGDFTITVKVENGEVVIAANRDGLITQAQHLVSFAQEEVPSGSHLHYEPGEVLEVNSHPMVISRVPDRT